MIKAEIGVIGNYDACLTTMTVKGYWRPLSNAKPFNGEIGKINEGTELKVEVNCPIDKVKTAVTAIKQIHPYEEPLINVVPLLNDQFS